MSKRLLHISRSSHWGCSGEKVLLKINVPSKSLENTSKEVQLPHSYLSRISAVSFNDFIDCHHRYQLLISASLSANHCHLRYHRHNYNGIRLLDDQLLFPELCHSSNYTWNIILIFCENDLNCAWKHFSFQPLDFKRTIFEDPIAVLVWKFVGFSIVAFFHIPQV